MSMLTTIIRTRYHGSTSRMTARAATGQSCRIGYDHRLTSDQNHQAAAMELAHRLGWVGLWLAGDDKDGATVWVNVPRPKELDLTASFLIEEA